MKYFLTLIMFFALHPVFSQQENTADSEQDIKFIEYLIEKEEFNDAVFLLKKIMMQGNSDKQKSDTLNYLIGWCYYNLKELDSSAIYLLKVDSNSAFYSKSVFFSALEYAYLHKNDSAEKLLTDFKTKEEIYDGLVNFEMAGLSLLKRNYNAFSKHADKFTHGFYQFAEQEKKMLMHADKLKKHRRKSALVAGLFSAVLPGSGKIYTGKTAQGIATFLQVAFIGLQAAEGYYHKGIKSNQLYIFGGMFTIFYIGNIWGSVLSVKVNQREFENEIDNNILFDLHIPLRTLFN